jgi:hypothetical protein
MPDTTGEPSAQEKLEALLRDLNELSDYLSERGRHSYELAQRFLENAQRNLASRSYDERQATMLEYLHSILSDMNTALWWHFATGPTAKTVTTALTPIAQAS